MQIDGNFGITAAISEMLLESDESSITLPALPNAWPTGSVTGLRARGNVTLDLAWANNHLRSATLHGTPGATTTLRYADKTIPITIPAGGLYTFHP